MAPSPMFSTGKKPFGAWNMKYATAISPEATKAAGRVNRPMRISTPVTTSMIAATPRRLAIGCGPGMAPGGKPASFTSPCSMNKRAATMRSKASRYGA